MAAKRYITVKERWVKSLIDDLRGGRLALPHSNYGTAGSNAMSPCFLSETNNLRFPGAVAK
jgi:hypothetical protein